MIKKEKVVTAEEVVDAVMEAEIGQIPTHKCPECSYPCSYFVDGHEVWFDGCCHCASAIVGQTRTWQHLADWINEQVDPDAQAKVRRRCGLVSMRWLSMPWHGQWIVTHKDRAAAVVVCPETGLSHWAAWQGWPVTGVSTSLTVAMHLAELDLLWPGR